MRNVKQLHEIRAQIEWLSGWANFGTAEDRAWREGFIEYLESLAEKIESQEAHTTQRKRAAE